ncbi:protein-L-isoaspartate O-methyltransferase family protein [Allokutzneria oryzae]|uniref:Protein-L-isoaspartate O-methyltransferase n=1 Tax=Allokutzneria oryzae TaxID=1378989 RepID=A0ABV5ZW38_9PSEU
MRGPVSADRGVFWILLGSGYSSALLASTVGPAGRVTSIDIDPGLVQRASALHARAGNAHVQVHASDGFLGWTPTAPYERIVGWTTPHVLPAAWVEQAAEGAVIATPVKIADIAAANSVLRCEIIDGEPRNATVHPGGYIEMAPEIITEFALPLRFVDNARRDADGVPWWISAVKLHAQPNNAAERLLDQVQSATPQASFTAEGWDEQTAFHAFLLASTTSPGSVGVSDGWGLGAGRADSVAIVLPGGGLLTAGTRQAEEELTAIRARWLKLGKPGHTELSPVLTPTEEGWTVRVTPRR